MNNGRLGLADFPNEKNDLSKKRRAAVMKSKLVNNSVTCSTSVFRDTSEGIQQDRS